MGGGWGLQDSKPRPPMSHCAAAGDEPQIEETKLAGKALS
jgi:hypothetical protein